MDGCQDPSSFGVTTVFLFILTLVGKKYGKLTPLKSAFPLQDLPNTFPRHRG